MPILNVEGFLDAMLASLLLQVSLMESVHKFAPYFVSSARNRLFKIGRKKIGVLLFKAQIGTF